MNSTIDLLLFHSLLKQVSLKFKETYTPQHSEMKHWKGQDIIHFQDDLRTKTGSSVSEKWFYTYVKNKPEKLPRIDILNMLAVYVGSDNWSAFAKANEKKVLLGPTILRQKEPIHLKSKKKYLFSMATLVIFIFYFLYTQMNKEYEYEFCFIDYYQKSKISNGSISISLIDKDESPKLIKLDSNGCFSGKQSEGIIQFIVTSTYYKNDTIRRHIKQQTTEKVELVIDDYALMLDYYSNGDIKKIKNRRKQLDKLLHQDVIIMELLPYQIGVTIYDKKQFIDKLTTPTQSLNKLEIIATEYKDEKIKKIKFRIKS